MKIKLKNTPDQVELIRAMGSKDTATAIQARETFAAFIGPVIQQVLNLLGTANLIYTDWPYNEDDMPSIPLDKFFNANVNTVQVWQQNEAGGLGTSLVTGLQEMLVSTYRLDTAVSLRGKEVRRGRLPNVSLALNRAAQELLRKQERNAWYIVFKALAEASTGGTRHTITATTQNVLQVDDFNRLITLVKRLNTAFDGTGTPDTTYTSGPTDLFLSPEMTEEIRRWAYNPMNTRATPNTDESTALGLPDSVREEIYRSSGIANIFGKNIVELLEFGANRRYNNIFATLAAAGIGPGGANFSGSADELVLGIDTSRDAFIRPIAQNADFGSELVMEVDDQFPKRADKLGYFGSIEEGRVCIDARAAVGLVI